MNEQGVWMSESDLEDPIDDLQEMDEDDEELPEGVEELDEEGAGTPAFVSAREQLMRQKRPSYLSKPDVLGYLNSFKTLDDQDRARLCRSVATYLQNQINTRNGLYRRRSVGSRKDDLTRSGTWVPATGPKKLKRTRSVRDLTKALEEVPASAPE